MWEVSRLGDVIKKRKTSIKAARKEYPATAYRFFPLKTFL
jgi:hypothetical protein